MIVHIPVKVLDVSGSGIKTTRSFAVGPTWDMYWAYDCASFGDRGNFIVNVYHENGAADYQDAGTNQLGPKGEDTEHFHHAGNYYLEVNSECSWHITVTG